MSFQAWARFDLRNAPLKHIESFAEEGALSSERASPHFFSEALLVAFSQPGSGSCGARSGRQSLDAVVELFHPDIVVLRSVLLPHPLHEWLQGPPGELGGEHVVDELLFHVSPLNEEPHGLEERCHLME